LTTKFTKIFTKNTKEKIAYFHEGGWNHFVVGGFLMGIGRVLTNAGSFAARTGTPGSKAACPAS